MATDVSRAATDTDSSGEGLGHHVRVSEAKEPTRRVENTIAQVAVRNLHRLLSFDGHWLDRLFRFFPLGLGLLQFA